MKTLKYKLLVTTSLVFLMLPFINGQTIEQNVIATQGGEFKGENITVMWTIGEVMTETLNESGDFLTQGLHQSFYFISEVEDIKTPDFSMEVFPNPTPDLLNIRIQHGDKVIPNLIYNLYDMSGRLLYNKESNSNFEQINLTQYAKNTYLLYVVNKQGEHIKTYKIQKVK